MKNSTGYDLTARSNAERAFTHEQANSPACVIDFFEARKSSLKEAESLAEEGGRDQ